MFFAVYAMTLRLTRPLRLMSEAARSMAKGDFSKRIPVESDDEMGELCIAFNQMTNSLVQLESCLLYTSIFSPSRAPLLRRLLQSRSG